MREVLAVLGVIFFMLWLLTGCASTGILDPNYVAYLEAKKNQPKIIEIVAKPGETISFAGVERFIVYSAEGMNIQQLHQAEPPWLSVVKEIGLTARLVGVPYVIGRTFERVVEKAVDGAGHNVTGSYNSYERHTTTTTTNTIDSYHTDSSIHDSYHTDNSTRDSYNTDNSIHDSYDTDNSVDNSVGYNPAEDPIYEGIYKTLRVPIE